MSGIDLIAQAEDRVYSARSTSTPRLTSEHIDAMIVEEQYHLFPGTFVTVCCLRLKNGSCVTGIDSPAHIDRFSAELGKQISRQNARSQVWQLEGYLLKQHLMDEVKFVQRA